MQRACCLGPVNTTRFWRGFCSRRVEVSDFVIEAEPRTVVGKKVKRLRSAGQVPITVYGPKIEPLNLKVPYRALQVALMKAGGTNLIDMNYDGKTVSVLAREVQRDVVKGDILHADFFAVDEDQTLIADIPVHLNGESPLVTARKAILLTGANFVTVEMLPRMLKTINSIEIDLTQLDDMSKSITVGDLDLGEDIRIINEPEETLARLTVPRAVVSAESELEAEGEGAEDGEAEAEDEADE
jgi:large subunit ribosomal protein L25